MPADAARARWQQAAQAQQGADLFDGGAFFQAHEMWEALWLAETDPAAKRALQGLIQVAAGYHKYFAQARPEAAARLLQRGLDKLAPSATPPEGGFGTRELGAWELGAFCAGVRANLAHLAQVQHGGAPLERAHVPSLGRVGER